MHTFAHDLPYGDRYRRVEPILWMQWGDYNLVEVKSFSFKSKVFSCCILIKTKDYGNLYPRTFD